jgi:hypothetical protein
MSTPGRRKALKALAARKRTNKARVQAGKMKKTSARALGIKRGAK